MSKKQYNELETDLVMGNEDHMVVGRHLWTNGNSHQNKFNYRTHIAGGNHRLVLCGMDTDPTSVEELVLEYFEQLPQAQLPTMRDYLINFKQCASNNATSFDRVSIQFIGYGASSVEPRIEGLFLDGHVARLPQIDLPDPTLLGNTESVKVKVMDINSDIDTLLSGTSGFMGGKYGEAMIALTRLGFAGLSAASRVKGSSKQRVALLESALNECDKIKEEEQRALLPLLEAIAELDGTGMKELAQQLLHVATVKPRLLNQFGTETSETDLLLLSRTDGVVTGPFAANDDEQYFAEMLSEDAA